MANFNEIQFSIDISITDLDAICINSFSTLGISSFYSFDREQIGDKIIVFKLRTNLDYMPDLGEIRLTSFDNETLIRIQEPRWPSSIDDFLFDHHLNTTNPDASPKASTSLTLVKSKSKEDLEIKSQARTDQMAAWMDFMTRFIGTLQFKSHSKTGPSLLNKQRFEIYEQIKQEHPAWTQEKVAQEATDNTEESHSVDSVRNAYRDVCVKWEKGNRPR